MMISVFTGKETSEAKVVKNNQPWFKMTPQSNQKPACLSNTVRSDGHNSSVSQRTVSSTSSSFSVMETSVKAPLVMPGGSGNLQTSSSQDGTSSEEMKSAEPEPAPEPVDNIPASPFTLRASNSKKYQRPGRPSKTSSEPSENSKPAETAGAKANSVLPAGASGAAAGNKAAAKPAGRGGGRVRDYTVLHPSCLSVCNVTIQDTIERSIEDLVAPAAPADLGEAGQMKKKSDAAPPKTTR